MPMWKSYDLYEELEIEINSDINFVKSINLDLRNIFQIKLHPGDGLFHNFETKKRWQENFKDLNIYDNKTKFDKFKNNSKLFIFNYESTGFLQLININFPTLLILRNFDYQVDESCKKDYESLISAKILHFNNESLNSHLNKIWKKPEDWWNSDITQKNINKFKKKYANDEFSTPENLKKILSEI